MTLKDRSVCGYLCVSIQIRREACHRLSYREKGRVRVKVIAQFPLGMPHQFHEFPLACPGNLQTRCERVAQGVEIGAATLLIEERNPGGFQISFELLHLWKEIGKDFRALR